MVMIDNSCYIGLIVTGHDRPALKFLNRYVRRSVEPRWYELGIELLEEDCFKELDLIQSEHALDISICCSRMFHLWLRKQPTASWNQLIESLRQPGIELNDLAADIEQMLLPSKPAGTHMCSLKCIMNWCTGLLIKL